MRCRNGPNWKDSIVFLTYDEHGGSFYDHAAPPSAPQNHALTTRTELPPGQCADLSNPPASEIPGGGRRVRSEPAEHDGHQRKGCDSAVSGTLAANPTGPYPAQCPPTSINLESEFP